MQFIAASNLKNYDESSDKKKIPLINTLVYDDQIMFSKI